MKSKTVKSKIMKIKAELAIAEQHCVNALNHIRDLTRLIKEVDARARAT